MEIGDSVFVSCSTCIKTNKIRTFVRDKVFTFNQNFSNLSFCQSCTTWEDNPNGCIFEDSKLVSTRTILIEKCVF